MAEARALIEVDGVGRRRGAAWGVAGVSLVLAPGEIHGLVGANGGGKTTALRMLAGLLRPDAGDGHVLGFPLRRASLIRSHVGYMAQRLSLYTDLSVRENLRFRAEVYGLTRPRAVADRALAEFGLARWQRLPAGHLSGGWARMLQLAAALLHAPRLVLLDEPTAGLDAVARQAVWQRLARLAAEGIGIVICTHDLSEAERCAQVLFLSGGRVLAAGDPRELAARTDASVWLLSGEGTAQLAPHLETPVGVIASHPEAGGLRVIARRESEAALRRLARAKGVAVTAVAPRLEDAALVLSTTGTDP